MVRKGGSGRRAGTGIAIFMAIACTGLAALPPAASALPLPTTSGGAYSLNVTSWRDMPFRRVVRQQYDYSCGSAALATLLRFHYGRDIGEAEIFKAMYEVGDQKTIRAVGFSLLDMKRQLNKLGYQADGFQVSLAEVERLGAPGIVLITTGSYRHFVVVKGIAGGRVLVGDPALGTRTFSRAEFQKMWKSGVFLAIRSGSGEFNPAQEWREHLGPLKDPYLAEHGTAALLRDLPTLYQITPVMNLP